MAGSDGSHWTERVSQSDLMQYCINHKWSLTLLWDDRKQLWYCTISGWAAEERKSPHRLASASDDTAYGALRQAVKELDDRLTPVKYESLTLDQLKAEIKRLGWEWRITETAGTVSAEANRTSGFYGSLQSCIYSAGKTMVEPKRQALQELVQKITEMKQ